MASPIESNLFIGFSELEKLIESHMKEEPVYSALITQPGKRDQHGIAIDRILIVIEDIHQSRVRYCRLKVGAYQTLNGKPLCGGGHYERALEAAESAYKIILDWLREQCSNVVEGATIAAPDNLVLLEGWAGFLDYDRERETFVKKED
ncbi:MAG: hypothetical protein AB1631_28415 [Acidobacteriota bacterium]